MISPDRQTIIRLAAVAAACGLVTAAASHADFLNLGIFSPKGDSESQQRATIQQESSDMLQQLYTLRPDLQQKIANAAGYATFKKTSVKLFLVGTGNGYGEVVNNQTGQQTYMRMASIGAGVGIGVDDLRVIFIFDSADVMNQFITQGWQFGGDADANANYQNAGVSAGQSVQGNVNFNDGTVAGASTSSVGAADGGGNSQGVNVGAGNGMQIYQFTKTGVSLSATVSGTKFWPDSDLND